MTALAAIQHPMRLSGAGKRDVRSQFGAIPYRINDGKLEILLITSRETRRWILPKGWPMDGVTPAETAATEAFEEAGVEGKISGMVMGFYSYRKGIDGDDLPIVVAMFPLKVKKLHATWPERGQRKRKWMSQKKAAAAVREPELKQLIRQFNPRRLKA